MTKKGPFLTRWNAYKNYIGDIILNIEKSKAFLLRWGNITGIPAVIVCIKHCAGGLKQHSKTDRQKQRYEMKRRDRTVIVCRYDYVHDMQENLQISYTNNGV